MLAFSSLDTVHKNKFSDKRFSKIEDCLGSTFVKQRRNFVLIANPSVKYGNLHDKNVVQWCFMQYLTLLNIYIPLKIGKCSGQSMERGKLILYCKLSLEFGRRHPDSQTSLTTVYMYLVSLVAF